MTSQPTDSTRRGLRLGRRVIHQLRASLERDTGLQAAAYLQEAGFAGGEELYAAFADWLARTRGVDKPSELDVEFLGEVLGEFFADQGWGRLNATPLGPAVLALDMALVSSLALHKPTIPRRGGGPQRPEIPFRWPED